MIKHTSFSLEIKNKILDEIHKQRRVIAIREPELDVFSDKEKEIIDRVCVFFEGWTAELASHWSHSTLGWQNTKYGDEIPYESVFLMYNEPVRKSTMEWAKKMAAERGA